MNSLHYQAGYNAAVKGEFRAAPKTLKIITQPWRDWYAGYDQATTDNKNKHMDSNFSQRKAQARYTITLGE